MSIPLTEVVLAVDASSPQASTPTELPQYRLKRLVFHVSSIGGVAVLAHVLRDVWMQWYIIVFFMALIVPFMLFQNRFGFLRWSLDKFQARAYEFNGRMSPVDFILGLAFAFAITVPASREMFACTLLVAAFCDPPGRLVGVMVQRQGWAIHWPRSFSEKTVQGSLAVWLAAWGTACLVVSWDKALLVALFATIAELLPQPEFYEYEGEAKAGEWFPWYGKIQGPFDNGLIPVATAIGFLLVM